MSSSDAIEEIRRTEFESRRRRQLMIGGSSSLLLVLVIAAVVAFVYTSDKSSPGEGASPKTATTSTKSVEMLCTGTDYQNTCTSSLSKVVKSDNPDPKELLQAAISVVFEEIGNAFNNTQLIKTNDTKIQGAMEDCKELFISSKEELQTSLNTIIQRGADHVPSQSHNIRTWLSAVMSYQQTCIDGFPDGELKKKMTAGMNKARELTSNALAIVKMAAKYLGVMNAEGLIGKRRLLEEEEEEEEEEDEEEGAAAVGSDELPTWMPDGDRRTLQEKVHITLKPNVTVSKDGKGQFKTISAALAALPKTYKGRYVIHVKPGVYEETVIVTSKMANVTIYGENPTHTIITGNKNFVDGTRTFQTATFAAIGEGFMAMGLTFRNTAGAAKHQAVALRVQSDRSVFINCNMEGYQDTLYAQTHRQFYHGCVISGTIDFIFGDAAAIFQNCVLVVRRPLDNQQNIATAQGRIDRHENTAFVLHRCRIQADQTLKPVVKKFRSYLGRPWKEYSRIVIMETEIGDLISPDGYMPWQGDFALKTLSYAEYKNTGPGAETKARVKWHGVKFINKHVARKFTVVNFLHGGDWIKKTGAGVKVPVRMGLYEN